VPPRPHAMQCDAGVVFCTLHAFWHNQRPMPDLAGMIRKQVSRFSNTAEVKGVCSIVLRLFLLTFCRICRFGNAAGSVSRSAKSFRTLQAVQVGCIQSSSHRGTCHLTCSQVST
jgi:hypothetical protein